MPSITQEQKRLMRASGKTLAIIGRFNPQTSGEAYVFSNVQGSAGSQPITPESLFESLQPALGLNFDETLPMGRNLYNHYRIRSPTEISDADLQRYHFQTITSDSPLLDTNSEIFGGPRLKVMQKHGGELVRELVVNLDRLAHFSNSNFSKSVLKIARDYMYHATFEALDGAFAQSQWFDVLASNYQLSAEIVKYLTSYERDEEEILAAIRAHMNNDASDNKLKQNEQEALEQALKRCKHVMKGNLQGDSIWEACAKFESNADWLNNYAGHERYGMPSLSFVGGRDFLKYYQAFLNASESTHRLVRSQTLHPFVVMWLAGKYADFDEGDFSKAAEPMYEHGIEGQGDKRIPGETFAERSDMRQRIRDSKIDKDVGQQLKDDELFNERFLEIAEEHTFSALIADRSVSAASLRHRAKRLFTTLSQLAGGKVGELYKELDAFNQVFVPFYRLIKNTRADDREGFKIADFKTRLLENVGERARTVYPEIDLFLEDVVKNAEQVWKNNPEDGPDLKAIVVQEYVSAYAGASKNHFAKRYLDNFDTIQSEIEDTERLYDIVRNQQQVNTQAELVGSPVVVMVETALPNPKRRNLQQFRSGMYEQQLANAQKQTGVPIIRSGAKPEEFKDVKNETVSIIGSDGQEVATAKFNSDATIEYVVEADKAEKLLTDDGAVFKVKGKGGPEVLLAETDFPLGDVQDFVATQKQDREEIKELLDNNALLAEKQNQIVKEYQKDADPTLTSGMRALLLCEYILAVPKSQSQLGKPDISNSLGLLVDIVENLVAPNDPKVIDDLLVRDGKVSPELSRINLSKYYPVSDGDDGIDELTDIINYQYAMASELSKVQAYLQELAEIRSFMGAMSDSGINIVFANCTVRDLVQPRSTSGYLFNRDDGPPSVVYLSTQAMANQASLRELAATFARYVGTDQLQNFQLPVFITAEEYGPAVSSALPIFDASTLDLNFEIRSAAEGQAPDGIVTDRFIQRNPYLLLAAAILMPEGAQNFGRIREIGTRAFDDLRQKFNLEVRRQEALAQVLRDIWLKSRKTLLDALIFCQWFNLLVLSMQNENDGSFTVADNQLADKIHQIKREVEKEKISPFHFALSSDYPVYVKDSNDNFLRPEGRSSMTMSLETPLGSKHRSGGSDELKLSFTKNFYSLVIESQGTTGGNASEDEAAPSV